MKPLLVLLFVFLFATGITRLAGEPDYKLAARIAMAVMLLFTAMGHFKFVKGMAMMLPEFIPAKVFFVYFTGIIEIVAAAGLLIPSLSRLTGLLLILFFVLLLPVNIYAALKKVDYEKATREGKGPSYLRFRIPLQLFFIAWVYWCSIQ